MVLTSVWEAGRPQPKHVPTAVEGHHDVAVVGGGLTGLTTALLLSAAGRSVVVLEAHHAGAGTTGRSTAKVSVLQGTRLQRISARQPHDVVRHYVEANLAGQAWLRGFCEEHGVATQARSAWTYATTEQGEERVRAEHEVARQVGLDTRLESSAPLPFPTTAAVGLADQLQLDPMELVDAMARQAVAQGARIVEGTRVRRVRGSGPFQVVTEAGIATADTVVVATNLPMLDRGGWFARMVPQRSYGLSFRGEVPPFDGMYLSADLPTRSLRDAEVGGERQLMIGGEGHVTGRGGSTAARVEALRAWTHQHFDGVEETAAWSAQDYESAHELPLAGPLLPGSDHLLFAGAYAKWGMTNAVAGALALSGRLLGNVQPWADAMAAWTRHELSGVPRTTRFNAEVALEMAGGWLAPLARWGRSPEEGEGVVRMEGPRLPVAVSRVGGVERRVSAVCTHLGGILRWNDAEASWDCPLHGSRFAPDGEVLEGPAGCPLAQR